MKILIGGATGFVGSELVSFLKDKGHHVIRLVRKKDFLKEDERRWNPEDNFLDPQDCNEVDCVVNLSGENVSSGRWTEQLKKKIKDSRIESTKLLAETLAKINQKPKVLINASACGFYGNREDEILTESSSSGQGFLAEVCREWEAAWQPAQQAGIRVAAMRFGMILSPKGGALKRLLIPFKLGLGGRIGSGEQYISWIALEDVLEVFLFAMNKESIQGPVNVVSPFPIQNKEFTEVLGKILNRPTFLPLPKFAAKLAFGEMAEELLLTSQRVVPEKLKKQGYQFLFPQLKDALKHYFLS